MVDYFPAAYLALGTVRQKDEQPVSGTESVNGQSEREN